MDTDTSTGDDNPLFVTSPQGGRDKALNYIRDNHDITVPFGTNAWAENNITPADVTTSHVIEYTSGPWLVSVVYRNVEPSDRVYRISITNHENFTWDGEVNPSGQVTETSVDFSPITGSSAGHAVNPEPTHTTTPTPGVVTLSTNYRDEDYRLGFSYPDSWSLSTLPAGRNVGEGYAAKTLELTRSGIKLAFQYKFVWEGTLVGFDIPTGQIEIRRLITLFGIDLPEKTVVYNGLDQFIFFDGEKDDLEFGVFISSDGNGISTAVQSEIDQIVASIARTGDPFPTPTISPTPKPTSEIDATRSGSGTGSTVSEDCNKASFVAHVTIPEGTLMLPGVKFTKVWRLRNEGICTWTTSYNIAWSTGDLMGADKRVPLPESVSPGSTVDIGVDFTSPDKVGHYQGYWILNDAQGYWFGLGEQKNGFIPIDINVFLPSDEYAYDFGIHYCDAVWRNSEMDSDEQLPCPGSAPSSKGYVILVADPALEDRHENEIALWVHPYEERNGWIKGTYPKYEVQSGDHFKAWVSCVDDTKLCSIEFSLQYKDSDGDTHTLGSWIETLDGKFTEINLDLASLVGQTVRFILKTEALTKNVEAAQGYWFVPRIENP